MPPAVRSQLVAGCGGRVHAAPSAGRRARGRRPAWAASDAQLFGQAQRIARRTASASTRLAGAARLDQRLGAGPDDQRCAEIMLGGRRGRKVEQIGRAARAIAPSNCWTNSSPWPPSIAAATGAGRVGACGEQRQRRHSVQLAVPADRQSLRGGDPDADSGEAARADADQDAIGPPPSSISSSIGTSRSAWPRPISSSRCATQSPGAVEQRGGAGGSRCVDAPGSRSRSRSPGGMWSQAPAGGKRINPEVRPLRRFPLRERSGGSGSRSRASA